MAMTNVIEDRVMMEEELAELRQRVAMLEEKVSQNDADLLALHDGSCDLSGCTQDEVVQKIIQLVVDKMFFDRVGVFLIDSTRNYLRGAWGVDQKGTVGQIDEIVFPLDVEPRLLSEAAQVALGILPYYLTQDLDGNGKRSVEGDIGANVAVPMRVGKRIVGVLCADNYFTDQPIFEERIGWLMALANQGAAALQNVLTLDDLHDVYGDLLQETLERKMEEALLESSRLVALGQMAAGMAHELNQPLTAISVIAEGTQLLLKQGIEIEPEAHLEWSGDLLVQVERMSNLIKHLRLFARDRSGEPKTEVAINGVVHDALQMIDAQLQNHGIELELELADDLPLVLANGHRLEQVVLNLVANARDALDEKEEGERHVQIRTRCEEEEEEAWIVLEVEDTGGGISEEHQQRLFQPFFTTKDPDKGTGLGLSIAYAIAKDHGGTIECHSEKGAGTLFRVRLPAAES